MVLEHGDAELREVRPHVAHHLAVALAAGSMPSATSRALRRRAGVAALAEDRVQPLVGQVA